MTSVSAVLLDEVEDQPSQARVPTVVGDVDRLVETAVGEGCGDPLARRRDRRVPERAQLLG